MALGVALERCAKRRHLGNLFDALLLRFESELNLWWERVERHAMHALIVKEAVQKCFDQFFVRKDLAGPYDQLVESREDCAELELQQCSVRSTFCSIYQAIRANSTQSDSEMLLESDSL